MDLLLLSSPPWHLVKTSLPPPCHCNVRLWGGVSLTLLRVKVSPKNLGGSWNYVIIALASSKVRRQKKKMIFSQVIFSFIFCFLSSFSSFIFCKRPRFKALFASVPMGVLASAAQFLWIQIGQVRQIWECSWQHYSRFFISVAETLSIASIFAVQATESFRKVRRMKSVAH